MIRSMTEKEKRIRDSHARADSDNEKTQHIFKRGWNECFDHYIIEIEKLKKERDEWKAKAEGVLG